VNHSLTRENLTGRGDGAQASSKVECATAVAAAGERHRLACVKANADAKRERGPVVSLLTAATLDCDGGAHSLAGRGKDDKCLVPAELDQIAVVFRNDASDDVGERRGERGSGLVTVLLGEPCVTPDVGNQEGANDRDHARIRANLLAAAVDASV
jgi:hypothetical protein